MTTGTFGENLKRERELRGVTLDEICSATRIAKRFLQAIENEQWEQLPGGVFNRGFVRAVARYLGLDEENTVAEYTLAVGDRPSVPVWTGSPPVVTPEQPWLAWILSTVILLALLAGGWFGTQRFLARRAAKRAAQAAAVSPASSSPPTETPQQSATETPPSSNVSPVPAAQNANSGAPAAAADPAPTTPPTSPPTDLIELKIETGKKTKVIVMADKDMVFDGTMKAGENHFFSAADQFQVSAKDAGALHLVLNGKMLAPIGPPGHAGKVTLTRDALKGAPGGAN
jgi:cytoskeleton protein RodZ